LLPPELRTSPTPWNSGRIFNGYTILVGFIDLFADPLNLHNVFRLFKRSDLFPILNNPLRILGSTLANPDDGSMTISCPKLPKDTDARIGVRRNPKNPDKKEKIFGYNLVLSTSVEVQLKLELPVAATNIAGNAEEGSQIIENKEQLHSHHEAGVRIDIAAAKYDIIKNYQYIREKGSIPIIDYNRKNENLSKTGASGVSDYAFCLESNFA